MKRLIRAFRYSGILAVITLFSVAFLWKEQLILTTTLVIISTVMLIIWNDKEDIYLYIIVGIAGACAEVIAIIFGAWKYSESLFESIPLWLPFLWGIAGVFMKKISLEIHEHLKETEIKNKKN